MDYSAILIDTSIIIEHLRRTDKRRSILFNISSKTDIYLSAITEFELYAGASNEQKQRDVREIVATFNVMPFDATIAKEAAMIYRKLRQQNLLIEMRDIFISATATINKLPLLSLNEKHFSRIENLIIVNHE